MRWAGALVGLASAIGMSCVGFVDPARAPSWHDPPHSGYYLVSLDRSSCSDGCEAWFEGYVWVSIDGIELTPDSPPAAFLRDDQPHTIGVLDGRSESARFVDIPAHGQGPEQLGPVFVWAPSFFAIPLLGRGSMFGHVVPDIVLMARGKRLRRDEVLGAATVFVSTEVEAYATAVAEVLDRELPAQANAVVLIEYDPAEASMPDPCGDDTAGQSWRRTILACIALGPDSSDEHSLVPRGSDYGIEVLLVDAQGVVWWHSGQAEVDRFGHDYTGVFEAVDERIGIMGDAIPAR